MLGPCGPGTTGAAHAEGHPHHIGSFHTERAAPRIAAELACAARLAGDADGHTWWLDICRTLDRRLAARIDLSALEPVVLHTDRDGLVIGEGGGMLASCFCISAMALSISGLPPILLWISHSPGAVLWARAPVAATTRKRVSRF